MRELSMTAGSRSGKRRLRSAYAGVATCGALLLAVLLTGCSQEHDDERGKGDAPVKGKAGEDTPAEVYNFPDGFGNLATKCVGDGKRGYVTTRFEQAEDQDDVVIVPANAVIVADLECSAP
ncbi:hypothetical protein [Streptomyces scabichelini]|uniref:hypothetical protein n=1 Tax=Streptomyces scabichelini TaxID=2711217 RepID=UPI0019D23639|nr:hypothetical protein [Streptomyces scabichelini]